MGYNKGVISGQALGEPSTQMLLRTFHLGGSIGNITHLSHNKITDNKKIKYVHKFDNIGKNIDFLSKSNNSVFRLNKLKYNVKNNIDLDENKIKKPDISFIDKIFEGGITKYVLTDSGVFSKLSFQETLRFFKNIIFEHSVDWTVDSKSNIIFSSFIPVGSGWYRYFF
ncbi:RpoC2-N-terminal (apicoplast) [Theileria orientalis strain Shintoku]|uniref:DNA-directed RNA polymerase n=1 Tax=Theileria orientalis strain Shintoku TaxID=869250 RepID=J7M4U3_THEOR|nr:RpoC2-N-terminal [Theileria orientalis strain Shintoku]BAM42530.1 RpoC2-N-terminal [Theileria orientalis strain Shintoku]|eukprot:XP_012965621.1 RpoC2-N-terminal [Theileria orientalis strain Shintoku]